MTETQALAAAVGVEHQVVYGYGLAGAHLAGRDRAFALAALDAHRARRDQLEALLIGVGATPPPAAPAYVPPVAVDDPASARTLCALLEDGCAGAAWDLVAASGAATTSRSLAVSWLTDAASAASGWRGGASPAAPPLPGQPS
jgi:hypothetical protein